MTPTASRVGVLHAASVVAVLPGGGLPVAAVRAGRHRCCRPSRRRGRAGLAGPATAAALRRYHLRTAAAAGAGSRRCSSRSPTCWGRSGQPIWPRRRDLGKGLQRLVVAIGFDRLGDDLGTAMPSTKISDWHRGDQPATRPGRAATESGTVAARGQRMSIDIGAAAGIVVRGTAPPAGGDRQDGRTRRRGPAVHPDPSRQAAALAAISAGLAEGTAVVAATKAQLLAPTAEMSHTTAHRCRSAAPLRRVRSEPSAGSADRAGVRWQSH